MMLALFNIHVSIMYFIINPLLHTPPTSPHTPPHYPHHTPTITPIIIPYTDILADRLEKNGDQVSACLCYIVAGSLSNLITCLKRTVNAPKLQVPLSPVLLVVGVHLLYVPRPTRRVYITYNIYHRYNKPISPI